MGDAPWTLVLVQGREVKDSLTSMEKRRRCFNTKIDLEKYKARNKSLFSLYLIVGMLQEYKI